ncbi:unnamed protein product [Mycena citricolor]|uniref:Uncharacterized protein n=1 Tax=Mycena citricolor TaxID=2018698 RepID=A0AAD2K731_9AGAR|nr:unnamed protein product [Mycena citricolor]
MLVQTFEDVFDGEGCSRMGLIQFDLIGGTEIIDALRSHFAERDQSDATLKTTVRRSPAPLVACWRPVPTPSSPRPYLVCIHSPPIKQDRAGGHGMVPRSSSLAFGDVRYYDELNRLCPSHGSHLGAREERALADWWMDIV